MEKSNILVLGDKRTVVKFCLIAESYGYKYYDIIDIRSRMDAINTGDYGVIFNILDTKHKLVNIDEYWVSQHDDFYGNTRRYNIENVLEEVEALNLLREFKPRKKLTIKIKI